MYSKENIKLKIKEMAFFFIEKLPIKLSYYISFASFRFRGTVGLMQYLCMKYKIDVEKIAFQEIEKKFHGNEKFFIKLAMSCGSDEMGRLILSKGVNRGEIDSDFAVYLSQLLLEFGCFDEAWKLLSREDIIRKNNLFYYNYCCLYFIQDDYEYKFVGKKLQEIFLEENYSLRPHQNLTTRLPQPGVSDDNYIPNHLDYAFGPDARIYDVANYFSQRLFHFGQGHLCPRVYQKALEAQDRLRSKEPEISSLMKKYLADSGLNFHELRIAPPEWFAQIGHVGLLEILLRMRDLKWWSGDLLILIDSDRVANLYCIELFKDSAKIIIKGNGISDDLWGEFISLQRYAGFGFGAWRFSDSQVLPWQDCGAIAVNEWCQRGWSVPFREAFDRKAATDTVLLDAYRSFRASIGLSDDQWFVCLHLRDGGFHGEADMSGQSHRNADFDEYIETIRHVHSLGGVVVRLGSPKAKPAPIVDGLVDYAHSRYRSDGMDLFLIRHAKAFLGTVSGLTNMAVSLDVPTALVNCITADAPTWHQKVRFALKPIRMENQDFMKQGQMTGEMRWILSSSSVMERRNIKVLNNSSDEILETLKQVLDLADGKDNGLDYVDEWRRKLRSPYFYGSGIIGKYFYEKYRDTIFLD